MNLIVTADARPLRRAVGVTTWAALEELLLDAHADDSGALVAATNVRRLAAQLGVSKDTAARAVARLARAGIVRRVVAPRGTGGALPTSSYAIELAVVDGITVAPVDAARDSLKTVATNASLSEQSTRHTPRTTRRVDDVQTSLFDLPASVS